MKIIVTGTDGYIGVLLASLLIEYGHDVKGIDTGFYRNGWLHNNIRNIPLSLNKDLRNVTIKDIKGYDVFIHLAELSNDPLGQMNPETTFIINHLGSVALAEMCKLANIPRFIYTSSCSVYGVGMEDIVSESSKTNPQTTYAKCKVLVERDVGLLADDNFSPTFLRNATAYGASPRMRFDIVLNNLSGLAWTRKEIKLVSDGSPWRPLVHVMDICDAIVCTLNAPREITHNQIFNVGDTNENYQIRDIAKIVSDEIPECKLSIGKSDSDNRSYRVSFDKINSVLPGFKCKRNLKMGAKELHEYFERIDLSSELFQYRAFTRLKQLEYLLQTNQIDDKFYWRKS